MFSQMLWEQEHIGAGEELAHPLLQRSSPLRIAALYLSTQEGGHSIFYFPKETKNQKV